MKKLTLLLASLFLFSCFLSAQDVIKVQNCKDTSLQHQADSLKQLYGKDGYSLLREAYVQMESEYEMPVVVPLQERSAYQIIFIGDKTSRLYEVRMYDYDEKMVTYQKKMWGDVDGNIISFSYTPQFTELHMIKPVQVNKARKKNLCGYIMLLKKTSN